MEAETEKVLSEEKEVKAESTSDFVIIKIANAKTQKEIKIPKALEEEIKTFIEKNGGEANPVAVVEALERDEGLKTKISSFIGDSLTPTAVVGAMSQPEKEGVYVVPEEVEALDPTTVEIKNPLSDEGERLSTEVAEEEPKVGEEVKPIKAVNDILGTGLDVPPSVKTSSIPLVKNKKGKQRWNYSF